MLAEPFHAGNGPTRSTINLVWAGGDATEYLGEGNKLDTVLAGLQNLRDGNDSKALRPDQFKLVAVVADLADRLIRAELVDSEALSAALARDGFKLEGGYLEPLRPPDAPADRLAAVVADMFGDSADLVIARNHFEQTNRAFDRNDWEAANGQFRSAFDATYDALAAVRGCPSNKRGGVARQWLTNQGMLTEDESDLLKAFAAFAGRNGSHPGLSDAADSQLRRHFATALISFGIAKLHAGPQQWVPYG
jgi:hypothetical protein